MTALADTLESKPFPETEQRGYQPRDIVLLGSGVAHLYLLDHLAKHPLVGATVTLVAPQPRHVVASMLPALAAGHMTLDDCSIAIEPLVRRAGVRWLHRHVSALDVQAGQVQLDDGSELHYDLLSINTGPQHSRAQTDITLPGARQHALFMLPGESFGALWPQVLDMGRQRALRVAVMGDNANALELAMAVRYALPTASVTLVAGTQPLGHFASPTMQARIVRALKQRNITVLQDTATSVDAKAVSLGCGAALACDVPLYAGDAQAAHWMVQSGLTQRDTPPHPAIWLMDNDLDLRSTGSVMGPALAAQLAATVGGHPLPPATKVHRRFQTQGCGDCSAIGSWGPLTLEGRWVWSLQQHIDRKALERYRSPS